MIIVKTEEQTMKNYEWDEDISSIDDDFVIEQRKNKKDRRRKWREIESLKEEQRLTKELEKYNQYSY